MASKKQDSPAAQTDPEIPSEVLDALITNYSKPSDLIGPNGLLKKLTAALVNRAMEAELTEHMGYEHGEPPPEGQSNRRNGTSAKRLRTDKGEVEVRVPRDREGTFEPQLVPKHQRHFDGFDDQILALYARGSSARDIQAHLRELYGVEVSPDLISRVTDAVVDELKAAAHAGPHIPDRLPRRARAEDPRQGRRAKQDTNKPPTFGDSCVVDAGPSVCAEPFQCVSNPARDGQAECTQACTQSIDCPSWIANGHCPGRRAGNCAEGLCQRWRLCR